MNEVEEAEDLGGLICPDCGALYFWTGADFEDGCPDRHI